MLWGANQSLHFRNEDLDFPEGPVVKNIPANARDTGSIPSPAHGCYSAVVPYTQGQLSSQGITHYRLPPSVQSGHFPIVRSSLHPEIALQPT